MEQITKQDLSDLIQIAKTSTGWTYYEMSKQTGIPRDYLKLYSKGNRFPKDPVSVVSKVKKALSEHTKEKMRAAR